MHYTELTPRYVGSVKTLYDNPSNPDELFFAFTDDFSVFDWGKMPDTIPGKGHALCLMGSLLMQELSDANTWRNLSGTTSPFELGDAFQSETYQILSKTGLKTHYKGLCRETLSDVSVEAARNERMALMCVEKASVGRVSQSLYETPYGKELLYGYEPADTTAQRRFIPLEVVFRLGLPAGSSMLGRFEKQPALCKAYGFAAPPAAWTWFKAPVIEFFTKLEAEDRKLGLQEALLISGLTLAQFERLYETAMLSTLFLCQRFQQCGLDLWDGKLEFAWDQQAGPVLVDTVGLDELRVTYGETVLSKEFLREFYRNSEWYDRVKRCQNETPEVFALNKKSLGEPPRLPQQLQEAATALYQKTLEVLQLSSASERQALLDEVAAQLKQAKALIAEQANQVAGVA